MTRKVDFVCVGAQKAGTTTLHNVLKKHRQISLPERKEAHFFDMDDRYSNGVDWWLENFFDLSTNDEVVGVITPEYLYFDEVPARIHESLGKDVKIVAILRQPIQRAYSHYLMSFGRGIETETFEKSIDKERERLLVGSYYNRNHFSYLARSYYHDQLKRYFALFGQKNVKVYVFEEDIVRNLDRTLDDIQKFLGVDLVSLDSNLKSNTASEARFEFIRKALFDKQSPIKKIASKLPLSENTKFRVASFINGFNQKKSTINKLTNKQVEGLTEQYFSDEIIKLESLLKRDLSVWK